MKKPLKIVAAVATLTGIASLAFAVGVSTDPALADEPNSVMPISSEIVEAESVEVANADIPAASSSAPADSVDMTSFKKGYIREVLDDGRIVIENANKLREFTYALIGIEYAGEDYLAFLKEWLPVNSSVYLEFDKLEEDESGNKLAYVYLPDGNMLQDVLLFEGLATFSEDNHNRRYVSRFRGVQDLAQEFQKGIWAE